MNNLVSRSDPRIKAMLELRKCWEALLPLIQEEGKTSPSGIKEEYREVFEAFTIEKEGKYTADDIPRLWLSTYGLLQSTRSAVLDASDWLRINASPLMLNVLDAVMEHGENYAQHIKPEWLND